MKAILEFDLDDTDDRYAHQIAVKAPQLAGALFEITHNLRKKCQAIYESQARKEDTLELSYEDIIFDEIVKILEDRNININEL